MKEEFHTSIEKQRFQISAESAKAFNVCKEALNVIKEQFPEARAMTFFGSRIVGQEKPSSDLDAFFFYDDEELYQISKNKIDPEDPNSVEDFFDDRERQIKSILEKTWDRVFLEDDEKDFHIHPIDCSGKSIQQDIKFFKQRVSSGKQGLDFEDYGPIVGAFCLGVGDIYPIRKQILEDFEKDQKGDYYYQELVNELNKFERKHTSSNKIKNLPLYEDFPKTLLEGKKYFLSKIPAEYGK